MGYVHDTACSQFIPANAANYVTGTWADAAGVVANTFGKKASLGDNTATISIPVTPIQNSVANKGAYLTSIDVWFDITGAAVTALDALIYRATLPADTASISAPTSLAFSYDTGHDTAAERDNLDQHKMTLTLTTAIWLDNDDLVSVEIIIDGATSSVVQFHGARANFTLRF